jgi:hypothetical protein
MKNYFLKFLKNIVIFALILVGMFIFLKVFYPDTIELFLGAGQIYTLLKLWPILFLGLLASLLPKRRR